MFKVHGAPMSEAHVPRAMIKHMCKGLLLLIASGAAGVLLPSRLSEHCSGEKEIQSTFGGKTVHQWLLEGWRATHLKVLPWSEASCRQQR